jgi:DNA-binding transcriptional MerR regulator
LLRFPNSRSPRAKNARRDDSFCRNIEHFTTGAASTLSINVFGLDIQQQRYILFKTFPSWNVLNILVKIRSQVEYQPAQAGQHFTSAEVMELTGITARQLQWWDERKIVVPSREGRNRVYGIDDLAEVAVICQLRRKGFSLQRVREVMRYLQRELGKRLVETVTSGSEYHLLTDGKRIYLENSERQIVDLLKNSRQPLLSVCLTDAVQEIRAEVHKRHAVRRQRGREERSKDNNRRLRLRRSA